MQLRPNMILEFSLSMGTFKNAIRSVKADPELAKKVNFTPAGHLNRKAGTGGSLYMPKRPWVEKIPGKVGKFFKNVTTIRAGEGVGVKVSKNHPIESALKVPRRVAALHEIGHAADHVENKKLIENMSDTKLPKRLNAERRANKQAVGILQKSGASPQEISEYRHEARKGFNTYRKTFIATHRIRESVIPAIKKILTGRGKEIGKQYAGLITGTEKAPISEVKRTLRKHPYLRGYGFAAACRSISATIATKERGILFS